MSTYHVCSQKIPSSVGAIWERLVGGKHCGRIGRRHFLASKLSFRSKDFSFISHKKKTLPARLLRACVAHVQFTQPQDKLANANKTPHWEMEINPTKPLELAVILFNFSTVRCYGRDAFCFESCSQRGELNVVNHPYLRRAADNSAPYTPWLAQRCSSLKKEFKGRNSNKKNPLSFRFP